MEKFNQLLSRAGHKIASPAVAVSSLVASGFAAAADDMSSGAVAAITSAQTQGTTVGTAVIGVVAALCAVGLIIGLVRKV